jgi:hypothetical protein
VPDEAIHRCIEPLCAKALPRRVNYCPYCGTAQHAGAEPHPVAISPEFGRVPLAPEPGHPAVPPQTGNVSAAPILPHVVPAKAGRIPSGSSPHAEPEPPAAHAASASACAAAPAAPVSPNWGSSAAAPSTARSGPRTSSPPFEKSTVPPGSNAALARPQREPIRLRWWLLALAALWMVWFMAKPSSKRIDARIDQAIALATDCKPREAQSELIALRQTRATPEQLQRLQEALNTAAADCRRQRKRMRALSDAGDSASRQTGAVNGVARPHASPGRQGTSRPHTRADGEP